jgi:hypothetical protein
MRSSFGAVGVRAGVSGAGGRGRRWCDCGRACRCLARDRGRPLGVRARTGGNAGRPPGPRGGTRRSCCCCRGWRSWMVGRDAEEDAGGCDAALRGGRNERAMHVRVCDVCEAAVWSEGWRGSASQWWWDAHLVWNEVRTRKLLLIGARPLREKGLPPTTLPRTSIMDVNPHWTCHDRHRPRRRVRVRAGPWGRGRGAVAQRGQRAEVRETAAATPHGALTDNGLPNQSQRRSPSSGRCYGPRLREARHWQGGAGPKRQRRGHQKDGKPGRQLADSVTAE